MDSKQANRNFARMKSKLGIKGKNLSPGALLSASGFKKPKKAVKSVVSPKKSKRALEIRKRIKEIRKDNPKQELELEDPIYQKKSPKKGFGMTAPKKGEDVYAREAKSQGLKKAKPVIKPKKKYVPGGDRTEGINPPGR